MFGLDFNLLLLAFSLAIWLATLPSLALSILPIGRVPHHLRGVQIAQGPRGVQPYTVLTLGVGVAKSNVILISKLLGDLAVMHLLAIQEVSPLSLFLSLLLVGRYSLLFVGLLLIQDLGPQRDCALVAMPCSPVVTEMAILALHCESKPKNMNL